MRNRPESGKMVARSNHNSSEQVQNMRRPLTQQPIHLYTNFC
jgi:hypothetical protein